MIRAMISISSKSAVGRTILRKACVLDLSPERKVTTWSPLGTCFNNIASKRPSVFRERTGLFGLQELRDANGFYLLKERAMHDADCYVNEALNPNRTRKMVQIFDDLSDCLCRVADMAEFVRVGHPEKRYSTVAEGASVSISSLVEKLNTNQQLYQSLLKVTREGDVVPTTEVDNHIATLFLFDFEQSGIHLDDSIRERVVHLNDYILHVGSYFMNNALQPRSVQKSQLPENIRHCFSVDGDNVLIPGLYADADNEIVREAAYRVFLYPDQHQNELLDQLLASRHELANLCGFPTYAHRALRGSLAGDPQMVKEFLKHLSEELKPRAQDDYSEMLKMKQSKSKFEKDLKPWDIPYYTAQAKQNMFNVKTTDYCPYLSLGACMEGLNEIFHALYGISMEVEETKMGEVWHPDVVKLAVKEGDKVIGYIYCDFFERQEKPNQDCQFTIQGGRLLNDGSYQMPVVVLMLNFPTPNWATPPLLTPSLVDNLFHEMGHAMHSMLARTDYQHVTGTRCATDLAEVPSILMEYFSSDPRVMSKYARHFQSGKPIPFKLIQNLRHSRYHFVASETQLQVFYALLDQAYHNSHPLGTSTTSLLAEIQNEHYGLPYINNTAWHLRFGHLVGYGAKYYSYLMSRAVAAWIWQEVFQDDPFNREAGERYRKGILAHGGSVPPRNLVKDFLQKEVTPEGLVHSLITDIDGVSDR